MANDAPQESEEKKSKKGLILIILLLVVIVALVAVVLWFVLGGEDEAEDEGRIGYAQGVVVLEEGDAVEYTPQDAMSLEYKGVAVSEDGQNFQCMIANSEKNQYDMYIDIYADNELTDELYLSQLFKPGTAFEEITLNRKLDTGVYTVYLVFTQVEDDQSTIHNQIVVTIDLVVN